MNDAEKKRERPGIGSIGQQFERVSGVRKKTSERPDVQESREQSTEVQKRPDTGVPGRLETVTLERQSIRELERQDTEVPARPETGAPEHQGSQTSKKDERRRQTVYLEPDIDRWIRERAMRERELLGRHVEISEIINNALRLAKQHFEESLK